MHPLTVKFADGSDDVLRILSIPFGGPVPNGKMGADLAGEYFSPRTNLHLDAIPELLPLLYDHGTDRTLKNAVIGIADTSTFHKDELGWWIDSQLDRHSKYYMALKKLIEKKVLHGSTASPTALNRKAADGEILDWWMCEQTLTPIPCNILSVASPAVTRKHYADAGLALPSYLSEERSANVSSNPNRDAALVRLASAVAACRLTLDGKAAVALDAKALNAVNLAHAKAAHDHLAAIGMDGGQNLCKGGGY
jgi:hypothetical protein